MCNLESDKEAHPSRRSHSRTNLSEHDITISGQIRNPSVDSTSPAQVVAVSSSNNDDDHKINPEVVLQVP